MDDVTRVVLVNAQGRLWLYNIETLEPFCRVRELIDVEPMDVDVRPIETIS